MQRLQDGTGLQVWRAEPWLSRLPGQSGLQICVIFFCNAKKRADLERLGVNPPV